MPSPGADVPAVRKVVIPVAGLGTRFLPATRSVPKELLPVVDRPLIEYAVHEAAEAGIDTVILVNKGDKPATMAHFEPWPELESLLAEDDKTELLEALRSIRPPGMTLFEAEQTQALGLGHAVLCAREAVADDAAFAVILPDDLLRHDGPGALAQLMSVYRETGASVIGVERIDPSLSASYGMAAVEPDDQGRAYIRELVEKPAPEDAPSNLGVVGRYVLNSDLFGFLERQGQGAGGEIQLTDAIAAMLTEYPVIAQPLAGVRYDCGSRLGMLKASIDVGLEIPELRAALLAHLARTLEPSS